jgi:hypothetical protein
MTDSKDSMNPPPPGRRRRTSKPKKTIPRLESMFSVSRLGEAETKEKFERLGTLRRVLCVDNSMEPSISRGDIVFVDTLKTHADCGIFAIENKHGGEEILVRLQSLPSGACVLIDSRGPVERRLPVPAEDGNGRRFQVLRDNTLFYSDWLILLESDIKIIGQYVCRMTEKLGMLRPKWVHAPALRERARLAPHRPAPGGRGGSAVVACTGAFPSILCDALNVVTTAPLWRGFFVPYGSGGGILTTSPTEYPQLAQSKVRVS